MKENQTPPKTGQKSKFLSISINLYSIIACRGTGCQVKGSKKILHTIKETIGIAEGETREDLMFSLDTVSCLGACALAPVMVINKDYFGKMTPEKVKTIFGQYGAR